MDKYKVLIVDDDPFARQLLGMFISQSENYELAGTLISAALAEASVANRKVDLILMDVCTAMNVSGIDAAEVIKKKYPEIKIIVITSQPEYSYITRARAVGVDSFWYKTVVQEEFLTLLDRTMAGERIFPDTTPTLNIGAALSVEFTESELKVLRLVVAGERDQDIAEELGVSINTVRTHLRVMMDKTGIRSRTALAVRVRDAGFVIVEPKEDEI